MTSYFTYSDLLVTEETPLSSSDSGTPMSCTGFICAEKARWFGESAAGPTLWRFTSCHTVGVDTVVVNDVMHVVPEL